MKTLFTFFIVLSVFSNDIFKEINEKRDLIYLKRLKKYQDNRKHNSAQREALKIQREDILKSKVILIAIKEGSILVKIDTGEIYKTPKEIIAKAFNLSDFEGYRYLISGKNKIRYKVYETATVNMKEMLSMYEAPKKFTPIEKKIDYGLTNKKFYFNYDLSLMTGFGSSSFIEDITDTNEHISNVITYDFSIMGKWKFPIKSGLGVQYQTQSGENSNINYNLDSFLLAFILEMSNVNFIFDKLNYQIKFLTELVSRLNIEGQSTLNISKNILHLGASKKMWSIMNGDILIGLNAQREWLKAKANDQLFSINSNNRTNDLFMLNITYRGDSSW